MTKGMGQVESSIYLENDYEGLDCVWIASDQDENVGAFVTFGSGPIFSKAVRNDWLDFEAIESAVLDLCVTSEYVDSDYVSAWPMGCSPYSEILERGFFVYDWLGGDVYQLMGIPINPISVTALPRPLRMLALSASLQLSFSTTPVVDPSTMFIPCSK